MASLKEGQYVWVCNWTWQRREEPKAAKDAKKPAKKAAKAAEDAVVDDVQELTRVAAKVQTVGPPYIVRPEWGKVCYKCAKLPEYGPQSQPQTIEVAPDGLARGEAYLIAMQESNIKGRQDMVELDDLKVGELMHNLRLRYCAPNMKYYTYVGEILIVMNPMQGIKDEKGVSYISEEYMHKYSGKPLGDPTMEPHIYAIGDEAYRLMVEHKKNQSIVISGESGAGKSESTKHVLEYIAHCSEKNGAKSKVNDMILATSELLETFGNAKTKRNHNSSRFGKFVEIQFDKAGGIVGAQIEQYLLEASRITAQEATERGYHVFYMMIVNLPADVKRRLYLTEVKDYRYLRGPPTEGQAGHFDNESNWDKRPDGTTPLGDDEKWREVIVSMNTLGLGDDFQMNLWKLMAGVLALGQINFSDAGANKPVGIDNMDAVAHAAELLCLGQDALLVALRQRKVVTTMKNFSLGQARDNVDALAKAIYSKMFVSLVDHYVNGQIHAPGPVDYFIGVLDIFGFESFQERQALKGGKEYWIETKNKFEQLCINLTNEQLQAFFYNELIPKQKKKYDAEQISISNIYYADNTGCLNLIAVGKGSLFGILNDVTFQATKNVEADITTFDKKWVADVRAKYKESSENVDNKHRKSKPTDFLGYQERDMKSGHMLHETDFCVYHYAGQVWYTVKGAVDRNKDDASEDLNQLCAASTHPLLAPLFSAAPSDEKKAAYVSAKFKEQLDSLITTLGNTEPFFVRCVKPNCIMAKGGYLEDHKVLEQLICAGMYAVIEMRQNGYPVERFPEKFVEEFKILEDDRGKLQSKGSAKDQAKYLCELCVAAYPNETRDRDGMAPFQIGVTKVFMKDNMAKALQLMKATAEALLKKKQAVAFGHIKALYLHWKEMKLLPERKIEAAKLAIKFARKRQLISEGKTPEEAERIIEEERIAEEKRLYEEYKAARYAPVEADYKPTMAPIADIMKSIDEFVAQPLTRKSPPELPQELRTRKAAIWECSQKLQAAFAKFTANIKDEVAEGESKELIAQLKKLAAQERDNMDRDKQRRQKEIADIAEEERLEKERLERLRKELEEKKRREEEARRREEEERIANAGRLAIEQEKSRIRKEREDKRNERLQRKEQILAEREAQRAEEQRHRDEERERMKKEHAREEREKAKMKKAQEKEDMMIHARSEALTSTHVKYEDMECEIKYYGRLPYEGSGDFVGIQCPKPCGEMNDGTLLGVKLFECTPGMGKFVRPKMLHIISPATGRLEEGNMVWVRGTKHVGEVMWVGEPDFAAGQWVGIKLEKPGTGKNNGTINGTFYFKCPELTGVFVRPASLAAVEPFTEMFVRSLTERYITMNNLDDFSDDEDSDMEAHLNQVAAQAEELTRKQVDAARKAELAAAPPAEIPM